MSRNPIPLIAMLLLLSILAAGQKSTDYRIFLRNGSIIPEKNISLTGAGKDNLKKFSAGGKTFTIIQFDHIPTQQERIQLAQAGIELLEYVPNNAYTASIKGALNINALNAVKARSFIDVQPQQKMSTALANKLFSAESVKVAQTIDVWVSFPKTYSYETVVRELKTKNIDVVTDDYRNYRIVALRVPQQRLTELASFPFIEYVQAAPGEDKPINAKDVINTKANVLNSIIGRNLNGEGVVIGIGDNADPLNHIDFAGRLINRAAIAGGSHGLHVMGISAGGGIVQEKYKGQAPKSKIVAQVFSGIIINAPAYVNDYGMVITNNSYGNVVDDCETFGVYDLYSRVLDQMAYDMPYLQNIFASGNSGAYSCSPYVPGFSNVLGGYQTAKNVITIGATSELGSIVSFSSKGPVRDGRIKPEIVVQGAPVISTYPINTYGSNQGTSMAAPGATGGLTLLYQRYRQLHSGANPKNALMKALLCNGATDKGNPGPDFSYGFGWMNLLRSVKMLENNNYINDSVANTVTNTHSITVPANTAQLKVMLYWNDPAAAVLASHALVNDLDLEVADPSSAVSLPFILDTIPGNVTSTATTGVDHVNNIEQVVINNPVAGTYTVSVKGTAININPRQEYFLVYDTIAIATTITYPIGVEHLVQGDSLYITWESYGNPANTFTIEYTTDDGATWNVINAAVAAGLRQLKWFVPAVFSDQARVRVTRNGSGIISTSERFTIVGVPVVTAAAVQCEGYFAINWTSIPEATGYEVMMLRGDEMVTVATVPNTKTNYTFGGLSKDSVYWVTVRSLLNTSPGRRAIAISRQPNNGTCTGTISDNDLKVDALLAPASGRELTSTALSATTTINVRIKNLDDAAINNFNIKYSVNGGAFVSEPNTVAIAATGTYTHNFPVYDFSATGIYTVRAVVENISAVDPVTANDTLVVIVKHLANPAVVISVGSDFTDDVESADSATYFSRQIGLSNKDRYDFVSNTVYGRLRTFVNSGIAYSGDKAFTLDADRYNGGGTADSLKATFNLAAYNTATDDIRLDFRFKHHGEVPNGANNVWIRGDDQKPWISVYDLYANQGDPGVYNKSSSLEISDILAANTQNFSSSFQVRWGQWGQIITADNETGAGYSFDDIHLYKVQDDIQMLRIDTPIVASCGLDNAVPVKVTVRNSSNSAIANIPVSFRKDGGAIISELITVPIAANDSDQYTFTATVDLSAPGAHTVEVWVNYPSDSYRDNDTAVVNLYNSPVIASFPYLQNFEADNGFWYTDGKKSSWQYGTPASQKINRAASGSKAWKTQLIGNYNDLEESYLYSPCFDVSAMAHPSLSFSVALDLEDCGTTLCDAAYIEYSADGTTWNRLGANGSGTNWYNKNGTVPNKNIWSVQDYTYWHVATIPLPTGFDRLRLRCVMSSDPYTSKEGIAIDDIHIYDSVYGIYDGVTMGTPVMQTVSGGTSWIDFTSGGKLVASVMPNNQNMGSTDVQTYINTGAVRTSTNQYYHDRNITIKPATVNLADSVTVRFYFLDTETENLINATGCNVCSKPSTAYELGVSKYTDVNKALENGSLTDDILGGWLYIAPPDVVKVPFDKGYYAEFKVKDFSEFWLNDGGVDNLHVLPVNLLAFTATKKSNNDVLVAWKTSAESDVARYEIELAKGYAEFSSNHFIKIGEVTARNYSAEQQYSFNDIENNKSGVRYYRLKIIDKDGHFVYSAIRPVVFDTDVTWQVYPNPSNGKFSFVYQSREDEKMEIKVYDLAGKLVKQSVIAASGFVQKISIDLQSPRYTSGLYLVEAVSGAKKQLFRVIKQ